MLFEWDFHKESMYVSANTLAKFDIDPSQATLSNGRFLDSLMDQENSERYKRDISMLLKNQNGYSAEYQLRAKSGAVIWVSLRANCITDRLGEPLRVIGVMTDIDNEKKLELQLSERASYDFLSKLYNRSSFIREFTSEIERRGQNKVAAMFLDVDDFKFINDRFGHTVGDEVIRFVADNIRKKVDDRGGFAGRFGGDEFVMCFTNQEDIENIEDIAMNIIDELNMGYTTSDGMLINVKISIPQRAALLRGYGNVLRKEERQDELPRLYARGQRERRVQRPRERVLIWAGKPEWLPDNKVSGRAGKMCAPFLRRK